jgi:hypothetical protein
MQVLQRGPLHACNECWQQHTLRADAKSIAVKMALALVVLAADAVLHATHRAHVCVHKVRPEVGEARVPDGLPACTLCSIVKKNVTG